MQARFRFSIRIDMTELDMWLGLAANYKATDIHIAEGRPPRLRIEGDVMPMNNAAALSVEGVIKDLFSRLRPAQKERAEKLLQDNLDVDCSFENPDGSRVRANVYRTRDGRALALRMIPAKRLTAAEIGIPEAAVKMCRARNGLFIVTGPNGSGKTSTLAAMLDIINETRPVHILTIEDPVEYVIRSRRAWVSQREVYTDVPNFYSALRSAVRENPDVIMLGEMRDLETTRTALELAETGHLVLATLHTRGAISTVDRLIGQFEGGEQYQIKMMLSENLLGVLSQILVPRVGGGLIAAFELLLTNPSVKNLIREQKAGQLLSVLQTNQKAGMISMAESLRNMEKKGLIKSAAEYLQEW